MYSLPAVEQGRLEVEECHRPCKIELWAQRQVWAFIEQQQGVFGIGSLTPGQVPGAADVRQKIRQADLQEGVRTIVNG